MRYKAFLLLFFATIVSINAQDKLEEASNDLLNLPGDNLDLYATLDLFQNSKTIEEFESSLNDEKTGINNLDLNLDGDVDFIKVVTQKEGDDFTFVLQVNVSDTETQDVGTILVSKDKEDKVGVQMVGDENLYGKDFVIEPKLKTAAVTANPGYSGADTIVVKSEPATVVVVESEPIVHYVYSPAYMPYYSPYYYGYYPPYYHPYPVISINIYFGRNRHHHNHYHGGRHGGGNTVIINNNNNSYNNYNKTRNTSNTVNNNIDGGKYKSNSASGAKNNKANTNSKVNANTKTNNSSKSKPSSVNKQKVNSPSARPVIRPASRPSGGGGRRR